VLCIFSYSLFLSVTGAVSEFCSEEYLFLGIFIRRNTIPENVLLSFQKKKNYTVTSHSIYW
jgi:hypothetical protein